MAHTINMLSDKALVIVAGAASLTVTVKKATPLHNLELFIPTFTIPEDTSFYINYDKDSIYYYTIVENGITTTFFHIQYGEVKQFLTNKLNTILNDTTRVTLMTYEKYDMMSLILLGIRYFGGQDFIDDSDTLNRTELPTELQDVNIALIDSIKYISDYIKNCNI